MSTFWSLLNCKTVFTKSKMSETSKSRLRFCAEGRGQVPGQGPAQRKLPGGQRPLGSAGASRCRSPNRSPNPGPGLRPRRPPGPPPRSRSGDRDRQSPRLRRRLPLLLRLRPLLQEICGNGYTGPHTQAPPPLGRLFSAVNGGVLRRCISNSFREPLFEVGPARSMCSSPWPKGICKDYSCPHSSREFPAPTASSACTQGSSGCRKGRGTL